MSVSIVATALKDVQRFFEELPEVAEQAAVLAINDTTEREGRVLLKRQMLKEVAFPSGYLDGENLAVGKRAVRGRLEGSIVGRDRPTSLARFAVGQDTRNTKGGVPLRVTVNPGRTETLKRAFIVNLNQGRSRGLAVRLKPGERLRGSRAAVELAPDVWLLYGPSVDQVLRGVADDRVDDILDIVAQKFLRQFGRLARG